EVIRQERHGVLVPGMTERTARVDADEERVALYRLSFVRSPSGCDRDDDAGGGERDGEDAPPPNHRPPSAVGRHRSDPDTRIPAAMRSLLATGLRRGPMKKDVSIPARVHVGPGPPEGGFPEAADALRRRGRLGGRARY